MSSTGQSPFRCLIFAAVSTVAQAADDKASLETQLVECRAACERNGWTVVREVALRGQSRSYYWLHQIVADSPEYAELVGAIEAHQINLVVCWRYDRLWRGYLQGQVQALCAQHGVQIYAVQEPMLPKPPDELRAADESELMQMLSGWNARREIQTLQIRRRLGVAKRVDRGLQGALSHAPYGYALAGRDEPMAIVPAEAAVVRRIFEMRADGLGYRSIAIALGEAGISPRFATLWRHSTIRAILHNTIYIGHVRWGQYHSEQGAHVPIISPDLWERAASMRNRRGDTPGRRDWLLVGLTRCGYCGYAMSYGERRGRPYLRCSLYADTNGRQCHSNTMVAGPVEAAVLEQVKAIIADPTTYWQESKRDDSAEQARLAELATEAQQIATGLARWDAAYEAGVLTLDELAVRRGRLTSRSEGIAAERDAILTRIAKSAEREQRVARLGDLAEAIDLLTRDELRHLYRELLDHIDLKRGEPPHLVLR